MVITIFRTFCFFNAMTMVDIWYVRFCIFFDYSVDVSLVRIVFFAVSMRP